MNHVTNCFFKLTQSGSFLNQILVGGALLVTLSSCQPKVSVSSFQAEQSQNIIGGEIVKAGDLTALSTVSLVMVQPNLSSYSFCTGTLISSNLVLTAAHCVRAMGATDDMRVAFSLDIKPKADEATMIKPEKVVVNPLFGTDRLNDVAVIKLSKPAPATHKPVAVLSDKHPLIIGQSMLLAGYGLINDVTGERTKELRQVTVPLAKILPTILVTDQTQNKGACNGDSGGPAYLEKNGALIVYGITRGPHENARDCHHFGEYTYASKFEKFITESAQQLKAELPLFIIP